jgi:hypothetical protein
MWLQDALAGRDRLERELDLDRHSARGLRLKAYG